MLEGENKFLIEYYDVRLGFCWRETMMQGKELDSRISYIIYQLPTSLILNFKYKSIAVSPTTFNYSIFLSPP
jgi:hypothetical protein